MGRTAYLTGRGRRSDSRFVLPTALVFVVSTVAIAGLIARQGTRQDSEAKILGVAPRRRRGEVVALVFCSAILALFPTLIVFLLFGD
jgi:ABC-type multidrug transport system permease subunit